MRSRTISSYVSLHCLKFSDGFRVLQAKLLINHVSIDDKVKIIVAVEMLHSPAC